MKTISNIPSKLTVPSKLLESDKSSKKKLSETHIKKNRDTISGIATGILILAFVGAAGILFVTYSLNGITQKPPSQNTNQTSNQNKFHKIDALLESLAHKPPTSLAYRLITNMTNVYCRFFGCG